MKRNKILLFFLANFIFTWACMAINFSTPNPIPLPTVTQAVSTLPATQIIILPVDTTYPEETPLPEWVTEFADPILFAIADQRPVFQDDFSTYRGWINFQSGTKGYIYAERFEEKLLLKLPEDVKESAFYNPRFLNNAKNFVLTLDLRFHHNQPEDTIRFQFDGFPNEHVAFDLSNNRKWTFHWESNNTLQSISGVYPHFPPEHVPVTIIMLDTECAVYLNDDPLVYINDCRPQPTVDSEDWTISFRLLREHLHAVLINIDNLKLWDLDRIPALR
jgi:hypothetical protein